ncbi:hypothetical protein pb186bvf_019447 [Paramecium bursaria]
MPTSIDVFQLQPSASEEDMNLCIEWIKAQLRAKQSVTLLVKRCEKQELIPMITVDQVSKIQQKLQELSLDPKSRKQELQELLQLYHKSNVKNQSLLIQIHIELAKFDDIEAQEKAIELLCKADEKIRKNFQPQFKVFLKDKIKFYLEQGAQETQAQNYKQALILYQKASELNTFYDEKDTTIQLNIQLGNTHQSLKELDQSLQIWEKTIKYIVGLGCQSQYQNELIYMYNNVGQIYYDKKSIQKATSNWDQAIIYLESQNNENQLELQSKQLLGHLLNNVGMIYYQKQEIKTAIINFQKTIEVYESIHGKNHISVGNRINNLGEAYRSDKQYDKALEMFYKALAIKKQDPNGNPSKSLASTINNIGMTLQNKGNYEEAIEQFQESLRMYNEPGVYSNPNAGDGALQQSNTMHSIAECYRFLKKLDLAINYFQQAYKLKKQELKIIHKSTQHTAIQLASSLFQVNQFEESLKIFQEVLEGQKQVYGPESAIVAQTINNIGTVLSELKQNEKAYQYVEEAIKIFEKQLNKNDPYLQKAYENMKNIKQKLQE